MKKINNCSRRLSLLLIVILGLLSFWAGKGLFKYNVHSTHDGNHHIARSYDAIETIKEGHFPLRWAGSLNYDCGAPIFNFFYPLFYYLVIIFNVIVGQVYLSLKLVSFFSLLIGTIFFYLWLKNETKNIWAAFGGAILYLFAPYRFLLIFVRESPEFLAYALLPVVLYLFSLCFERNSLKKFVFLAFLSALAGGLLTISHNFTVMFLMPVILVYLIIKTIYSKPDLKRKLTIGFVYLSSLGLGAFFIFPALLEKKFTKIGLESFLDFRQHFPTLGQLIKSPWGYFYSAPGVVDDGMSFQLGYAHWLVLLIMTIFFGLVLFRNKKLPKIKLNKNNVWLLLFGLLSVGSIFLILPWSLPVWEAVPIIQQIQFSWRILGLAVFAISALFAFFLAKRKTNILILLLVPVVGLAIYGNRNHLLPQPVSVEDLHLYDDFDQFHYHRHSTTTLGDDIIAPSAAESCSFDTSLIVYADGEPIEHSIVSRGNTHGFVKFIADKEKLTENGIRLGLGYFPGAYRFNTANGEVSQYQDCRGQICILGSEFRDGENYISWQVVQTPIQRIFNFVSILFLLVWLTGLVWFVILKKTSISKNNLFVGLGFLIVFGLFAYFRFSNLPRRIIFNWDQERDATIIRDMVTFKKPVLIGPRVLGPGGFFLPPTFYYLLMPFYLIANLNPSAMIWLLVFYNLAFFIFGGLIVKKMFGWKTSLIFLFLWSIGLQFVSVDTISWNPLIIPIMVLFFMFLIDKFLSKSRPFSSLLLGLVLGLGISFHIQFLGLIPLLLVSVFLKKDMARKFHNLFLVLVGATIPFLPLLIFDLRHGFINLGLVYNLIFSTGVKEGFGSFLPVWQNVVNSLLRIDGNISVGIVFYLIVFFVIIFLYKKTAKKDFWKGILGAWVLFPIAFAVWGKRPSEYYFNYLLPIIVLSFSVFAVTYTERLKGFLKLASILIVLLATFLVSRNTCSLLAVNKKSLYYKEQTAIFLSQATKDSSAFNISFDVPLGDDAGYRYLFDYWQVASSNDFKDPLIEVVSFPEKNVHFKFGGAGLSFPSGWLEDNWL